MGARSGIQDFLAYLGSKLIKARESTHILRGDSEGIQRHQRAGGVLGLVMNRGVAQVGQDKQNHQSLSQNTMVKHHKAIFTQINRVGQRIAWSAIPSIPHISSRPGEGQAHLSSSTILSAIPKALAEFELERNFTLKPRVPRVPGLGGSLARIK